MTKKHLKLTINTVLLIMGIGMVTFPIDGIGNPEAAKTSISDKNAENGISPAVLVQKAVPVIMIAPTAGPVSTPDPVPTPTSTPSPTLSPSQNPLFTDVSYDIRNLAENYYITKLASMEEYKKLFFNPEHVDEELTSKRIEYIVSYHDLEFYFKKGTGIVDYVAYVINYAEIATIETYAASIDQLFIRFDEEGLPKIYLPDEELSAEEAAYYNELASAEDVMALVNRVNEELLNAVQEDSDLRDFLMKLTITSDGTTGQE